MPNLSALNPEETQPTNLERITFITGRNLFFLSEMMFNDGTPCSTTLMKIGKSVRQHLYRFLQQHQTNELFQLKLTVMCDCVFHQFVTNTNYICDAYFYVDDSGYGHTLGPIIDQEVLSIMIASPFSYNKNQESLLHLSSNPSLCGQVVETFILMAMKDFIVCNAILTAAADMGVKQIKHIIVQELSFAAIESVLATNRIQDAVLFIPTLFNNLFVDAVMRIVVRPSNTQLPVSAKSLTRCSTSAAESKATPTKLLLCIY